jgi:hypothetical protein
MSTQNLPYIIVNKDVEDLYNALWQGTVDGDLRNTLGYML